MTARERGEFATRAAPSPPGSRKATLAGCEEPTLLLVLDPDDAEVDLLGGRLSCQRCPGSLGPWGWARSRPVRQPGGILRWLRPRRARCRGCGATDVLLPAAAIPRRVDSAASVLRALTRASTGLGHRRIAVEVGVPAATVRNWLRRARRDAEELRLRATVAAHAFDPVLGPIHAHGSPLADAVEAIGLAVGACIRRGLRPVPPQPAALAVIVTRGLLVARPGVQ